MRPEGVEGGKKQFHASESIYIYTLVSVCVLCKKRKNNRRERVNGKEREGESMEHKLFLKLRTEGPREERKFNENKLPFGYFHPTTISYPAVPS